MGYYPTPKYRCPRCGGADITKCGCDKSKPINPALVSPVQIKLDLVLHGGISIEEVKDSVFKAATNKTCTGHKPYKTRGEIKSPFAVKPPRKRKEFSKLKNLSQALIREQNAAAIQARLHENLIKKMESGK